MPYVKMMVYKLTAFYKDDTDEECFPASEEECYLTYESALKAKEEWLLNENIECVEVEESSEVEEVWVSKEELGRMNNQLKK